MSTYRNTRTLIIHTTMTFDGEAAPEVDQTYRVLIRPGEAITDVLERENRNHQYRLDLQRANERHGTAA